MKMGTLYRLEFSNHKSYIGVTHKPASRRYSKHARSAKQGSPLLVHSAWRKHGAPELQVLAVMDSRILLECGKRAVFCFGTITPGGYNMTPGGELMPRMVPEIAARMRGRKISNETRSKMSRALKGRVFSEETRRKISEKKKGVPYSQEARKNMAEAHKRFFASVPGQETKKRISLKLKGKPRGSNQPFVIGGEQPK